MYIPKGLSTEVFRLPLEKPRIVTNGVDGSPNCGWKLTFGTSLVMLPKLVICLAARSAAVIAVTAVGTCCRFSWVRRAVTTISPSWAGCPCAAEAGGGLVCASAGLTNPHAAARAAAETPQRVRPV